VKQRNIFRQFTPTQWLWLLALVTLVIKLSLFPFAQQVDSDGVSRIFTSMEWARHPYWILTNVWAPFHYYFSGLMLMIWNNPEYSPALLHVLISIGLLFPFYFFTRREFNANGALAATFFLAISPVLFKNSFLVLAEIPGLFFIVMAMNWLSKGFKENNTTCFFLAGFAMTIASGFRYEAWLLSLMFGMAILLRKQWKQAIIFGITAAIFPLVWMVQNYVMTGDALYSISANSRWTFDVMNINRSPGWEGYLRRIWFFPFSWFIALGPPVAWIVLRDIIKIPRKAGRRSSISIWSYVFWSFFIVMVFNAITGKLMLHHRFTGTLVIFSLPFIAHFFKEFRSLKIKQLFIFGGLTIALSFVYNIGGVSPLPRLKNQKTVELAGIVQDNIRPNERCIIDFIGWQDTWYIGLKAASVSENLLLIEGNAASAIPEQHLKSLLENKSILILLKSGSTLDAFINIDLDPNLCNTLFTDNQRSLVLIRYSPTIGK
jgi:hypothetical protein